MTRVDTHPDLAFVIEPPVDEPSATNRRAEPRHPPASVPEIASLRLSPGDAGQLINISATGLLMESLARYAPGGAVTVHFEGTIDTKQIKGRIVRCQVSAIGEKGALHYQTAVVFKGRVRLAVDEANRAAEPDRRGAEAEVAAESDLPAAPNDPPELMNRW